jgi:NifU-like protein involved in Fe-S cluster formation
MRCLQLEEITQQFIGCSTGSSSSSCVHDACHNGSPDEAAGAAAAAAAAAAGGAAMGRVPSAALLDVELEAKTYKAHR